MKTFCALLASALGMAALAASNPYDHIATRNIFGLRPPPTPSAETNEVWKPPPDYKLNGVAGFGATRWALISKAPPGKPAQTFLMREGQREGSLELLHVDEISSRVRVRTEAGLLELTFDTNATARAELATKKFVEDHTRAHELHQKREAERIARERAEFARLESQRKTIAPRSAAEQAVAEAQR